jgi:site-specific recombinase XerD
MVATYQDIENTCIQIRDAYSRLSSVGAVFSFLYNTGCRIEEAIQLPRITLETSTFVVDTEKNSQNRTFGIELLPTFYKQFLPIPSGDFSVRNLSSYSNAVRCLYKATDKIYYKGQKDILTNIFRYRYAYLLREQGLTNEQIQIAFGHLSLQSTLSYLSAIEYR